MTPHNGNGGRNPWSRGCTLNPPDLDAFARHRQDRFKLIILNGRLRRVLLLKATGSPR